MYDLEEPGKLMRALRRTIWPPQCAFEVPEPCGLYGLIPSPQVWRHLAASASLIALKASIGSRQRFSIQPGISASADGAAQRRVERAGGMDGTNSFTCGSSAVGGYTMLGAFGGFIAA